MLTAAADPAHPVPLDRLSELLSTAAARRFRLHPSKGEIAAGADADLVIINVDSENVVTEESLFYQHPAHSPYIGRQLRGKISRTLLRGQTIYKDGRIVARPSARLLRPAENPLQEAAA